MTYVFLHELVTLVALFGRVARTVSLGLPFSIGNYIPFETLLSTVDRGLYG